MARSWASRSLLNCLWSTATVLMPRSAAQPLYELRAGQQARVERVSDRDPELLRYLAGLGILPNTHLRVL